MKDTIKFSVIEALTFRIFYLAYEDTTLIVMTAGHGVHCKEKNSCNISFKEKCVRNLSLFCSCSSEKSSNNRQI